jgi:hypothetical protein
MAGKDEYYKNAAAKDAEAKDILNSSRMAEPDKRAKVSSILSGRTKAFEERRKKSKEEDEARKASIKEKLTYITDTQVKDTPEEVSKITSFLTEEAAQNKLPDPYSQESIDQGSLTDPDFQAGVVSDSPAIRGDRGDQSVFDEKSTMRQDFFNELKSLSSNALNGKGNLTPEMYAKAKEQLGKYEGVSGKAFEAAMKKNSIKPSNFTTAAPTSSPEEAAQNVIFQREYGTGLGSLAAMQDPNYKIGSGSPLRQPSRAIGPESGKARRASRRLRRQGYGRAAEQMAMAGEMVRANEPSIDTPALRAGRLLGKIDASKEVRKQEEERKKQAKIASGSKNMFDAMGVKEPKSNDSIEQSKKSRKTPKIEARERDGDQIKKAPHLRKEVDPQIFKNLPHLRKEVDPQIFKSLPHLRKEVDPQIFRSLHHPEFTEATRADGTFLHDKAIPLDEVGKREQGPVYYDKDGNEMMISEYQTMEFRDSNGNGIEDRREGIYRKSDYVKKPKGPRPRGL